MTEVQIPARPAILYGLSRALADPKCENPAPLVTEGLRLLYAGRDPMSLEETAWFLDAGSEFLKAAGGHYTESILSRASAVLSAMRDDLLSGALIPVPGNPSAMS